MEEQVMCTNILLHSSYNYLFVTFPTNKEALITATCKKYKLLQVINTQWPTVGHSIVGVILTCRCCNRCISCILICVLLCTPPCCNGVLLVVRASESSSQHHGGRIKSSVDHCDIPPAHYLELWNWHHVQHNLPACPERRESVLQRESVLHSVLGHRKI